LKKYLSDNRLNEASKIKVTNKEIKDNKKQTKKKLVSIVKNQNNDVLMAINKIQLMKESCDKIILNSQVNFLFVFLLYYKKFFLKYLK
jgi:hypothetical protein